MKYTAEPVRLAIKPWVIVIIQADSFVASESQNPLPKSQAFIFLFVHECLPSFVKDGEICNH